MYKRQVEDLTEGRDADDAGAGTVSGADFDTAPGAGDPVRSDFLRLRFFLSESSGLVAGDGVWSVTVLTSIRSSRLTETTSLVSALRRERVAVFGSTERIVPKKGAPSRGVRRTVVPTNEDDMEGVQGISGLV